MQKECWKVDVTRVRQFRHFYYLVEWLVAESVANIEVVGLEG